MNIMSGVIRFFEELFVRSPMAIEDGLKNKDNEFRESSEGARSKGLRSWSLLPEDNDPNLKPELRELMRERRLTRQATQIITAEDSAQQHETPISHFDGRVDEIMESTTAAVLDYLVLSSTAQIEAEAELREEMAQQENVARRSAEKAAIIETMRRRASNRGKKTSRRRSLSSPPERERHHHSDESDDEA